MTSRWARDLPLLPVCRLRPQRPQRGLGRPARRAPARASASHELHAVKRFFDGVTRDVLFDWIFALAQRQARDGRFASRAGGGSYRHNLPGQAKADASGITLIGDKRGAGTAWQLERHWLLEHTVDSKMYIEVQNTILHVTLKMLYTAAVGMARGRTRTLPDPLRAFSILMIRDPERTGEMNIASEDWTPG